MLMPCSAKIGELAIAWPRRPAPMRAMLCCPCVRRIFRISPSSESIVVADAALAELPEGGEVAPDLRRVDVRVLGDLLRGDPRLPHLPGLRQHLEVAGEAHRDHEPSDDPPSLLPPLWLCDTAGLCRRHHPLGVCLCNRLPERLGLDEVGEPAPPVDLDDRDPFAVLEPRARGRRRCRPPAARTRAPPAARAPARAPVRTGGSPCAW